MTTGTCRRQTGKKASLDHARLKGPKNMAALVLQYAQNTLGWYEVTFDRNGCLESTLVQEQDATEQPLLLHEQTNQELQVFLHPSTYAVSPRVASTCSAKQVAA